MSQVLNHCQNIHSAVPASALYHTHGRIFSKESRCRLCFTTKVICPAAKRVKEDILEEVKEESLLVKCQDHKAVTPTEKTALMVRGYRSRRSPSSIISSSLLFSLVRDLLYIIKKCSFWLLHASWCHFFCLIVKPSPWGSVKCYKSQHFVFHWQEKSRVVVVSIWHAGCSGLFVSLEVLKDSPSLP